jgi:hypothetical protein
MKLFDKNSMPPGSRVLYLTLKKKWFDMTLSGEKLEEYREIGPYWAGKFEPVISGRAAPYTHVLFRNGYLPKSPWVLKTVEKIGIGRPQPGHAPADALGIAHYVITHGKIIDKYE